MMVGYVQGAFFYYDQTKLSESRHFDLGDIPHEVRIIKATIPFSNRGTESLIIEKVDSPCSCFIGWDGNEELDSGYFTKVLEGMINVYFNKDKIESGSASIPVIIKTNDPSNSEVKIFFDLSVARSRE